ncbi:ubiquinone biosynthesis hydrox [Basidiobolus meristosporus CBS 931.73]|uniref:Ubiquinone biosynthesis monooxygenase COQ6, mitochondrial n=1 Tax=Basidiobolus meristosporus CBS 931.73 TaxID=1314790 RepID=A0A1Y1WYC6_9FUNG|nr:ubiquinone biosynthesis hydrox [Basidiobolus meristosporus CBS 931.73]|eukprot:ORX78560.1 ubiquinone biosynthesis hydrox [Basidiobolus meristosporus CBS 931.73]
MYRGAPRFLTTISKSPLQAIRGGHCSLAGSGSLRQFHSQSSLLQASPMNVPFSEEAKVEKQYDIVILGGGIAGSSLACALAGAPELRQKKIALLDAFDLGKVRDWVPPEKGFMNRVVSLTPSSVKFLRSIGAWDRVRVERSMPYQHMEVWDGLGDGRVQFSTEMLDFPAEAMAWIIENNNIQSAVLQKLAEYDNAVDVIDNSKVQEIFHSTPAEQTSPDQADTSEWPVVRLENGTTLRTRLLVGADGVNSPVRKFAQIESYGWDYDQHGIVATLQHQSNVDEPSTLVNTTAWQRFLPTGPIAMLPLDSNHSSLVWSVPPSLAAKLKLCSPELFSQLINAAYRLVPADLDYLYTQIGDDGQALSDIMGDIAWREEQTGQVTKHHSLPPKVVNIQDKSRASFPFRLRNAERYVEERLALVGDAAHATHPLAGQGLNYGLGDVQSISKVIIDGVRNGQDIGNINVLTQYSAERFFPNAAMLGAVDKLKRLFAFNSAPIVWARSFGLDATNAMGPLKTQIVKYAMGLETSVKP